MKNINRTISLIISRQRNTVRSISIVTQQTSECRTFTEAFLEKTITRNLRTLTYSAHLDNHYEQIQLNLQLQTQRERAVEDNEMGKMLCQLVKQQSAPTVDIEEFDGNPLQYTYSRSMFQEIVEKKIPDPQKRLKQLVKLATEVRELFKPFVHDNLKYDYKNAISYWRDSMGTHSSCRHVAETK